MNRVNNRWGIELNGREEDQKAWQMLLKAAFRSLRGRDQARTGQPSGIAIVRLRRPFNCVTGSRAGKRLFSTLNVAMSKNATLTPLPTGRWSSLSQTAYPVNTMFLEAGRRRDPRTGRRSHADGDRRQGKCDRAATGALQGATVDAGNILWNPRSAVPCATWKESLAGLSCTRLTRPSTTCPTEAYQKVRSRDLLKQQMPWKDIISTIGVGPTSTR